MDFNPYRSKLADAERRLRESESQALSTSKELIWFRGFDLARATREERQLAQQIAQARSRSDDASAEHARLASKASELERRARERKKFLGIPYAATDRSREAQRDLDRLRPKIKEAESQAVAADKHARTLDASRVTLVADMQKYGNFEEASTARALSRLHAEIQRQTTRCNALAAQVSEIDTLIAPELKKLQAAQKRTKPAQIAVDEYQDKIDRAYAKRNEAFELRDRLNSATTPRERALLHEESEHRFGNGKPNLVARDCKERIDALKTAKRSAVAALRECEKDTKTVENQIRAMVRDHSVGPKASEQRPTRARSWIRLAQMEAYIGDREGRSTLSSAARADLADKTDEAAEFRNRLEKKSTRGGRPVEDQPWWGEWTLDHTALGSLEAVGGGGQADIYRPSRYPGLLYKEYKTPDKVEPRALESLMRMRRTMTEVDRDFIDRTAAWPAIVVNKSGTASGFLMASAADQFFHHFSATNRKPIELQYLIFPPKPAWKTLPLPDIGQRLEICLSACRIVSAIHAAGGVVGDISAANILWSLSPLQAYLIDCDGISVAGRNSVLPPVNTPHWMDPRDPNRATTSTDLYKLAQVVVRVLSIEPYREPTDGLTTSLPLPAAATAPINDLLSRCADASSARPSADEWISALSAAHTKAK